MPRRFKKENCNIVNINKFTTWIKFTNLQRLGMHILFFSEKVMIIQGAGWISKSGGILVDELKIFKALLGLEGK